MRIILLSVSLLALVGCRNTPVRKVSVIEMGKPGFEDRLQGFEPSSGDWRWTSPSFAVTLDVPPVEGESVSIEIDYAIPVELRADEKAVTFAVKTNGRMLGSQQHAAAGRFQFSRAVPADVLGQKMVRVECSVDKSHESSGKQRGAIVVEAALRSTEDTAQPQAAESKEAAAEFRRIIERRKLPVPASRELEFLAMFHELPVEQNVWFHSTRMIKNPLDLWVMQELIHEIRPDFIVETGTWRGGSALFWAQTLEALGLERSRVLTVDIQDLKQAASADPLWKKYVQFFLGSSTDPKIVSEIDRQVKGGKVLVALDSDHSRRHVLKEMQMYAPMVSRGSYLIVEDTHLDGVPTHPEQGPGPTAAILRFMREGGSAQFEQDLTREASGTSWNAGGWLRRRNQ